MHRNLYVTTLESRGGEDVSSRGGTLWRLVSADKVPEGAVTVPLGEKVKGTPVSGTGELNEGAATPTALGVGTDAMATGTLNVGMNEMFFDPDQIEIPADTDVPVMLENPGVMLHNFTVTEATSMLTSSRAPLLRWSSIYRLGNTASSAMCQGTKRLGGRPDSS